MASIGYIRDHLSKNPNQTKRTKAIGNSKIEFKRK
jgi:hypothetical protein